MAKTVYISYEILNILSNHKLHSIRKIANELNLNKNTVYKHINELALYYPIDIQIGKYGGVRLMESYSVGGKLFNNEELQLIIKALELLQSSGTDVSNLIKKISSPKREI